MAVSNLMTDAERRVMDALKVDRTVTATRKVPFARKDVDAYVREVNRQFAIVDIGSGSRDTVVAEFTCDQRLVCTRDFNAFKRHTMNWPRVDLYSDGPVRPSTKLVTISDYWLTTPGVARRYNRLVFAPPGSPEVVTADDFNIWGGLSVAPNKGDWSAIHDYILNVLCAGNEELLHWVLNWIAALVQQPGRRAMSAVLLKGAQGTGKTTLGRFIGSFFREMDWVHLTDPARLTARFNSYLANKPFVVADEAVWGTAAAADLLKGLITEPTIQAEQKYRPVEEVPNLMHLLVISNHETPLPVERGDRRFCVLEVSDARKQDTAYFTDLARQWNAGAREAMLADLTAWKVDWDALMHPPATDAKAAMKAASLSPVEVWWQDRLANADPKHWTVQGKEALLGNFAEWKTTHRQASDVTTTQRLGKWLTSHFTKAGLNEWPKAVRRMDQFSGQQQHAWEFPSLDECRAAFNRVTETGGM